MCEFCIPRHLSPQPPGPKVNGEEVILQELPMCDTHKYIHGKEDVTARYDGKTTKGPWAFMCEDCFQTYGIGLGVGVGQRLVLASEKREATP